MRSVLPEQHRVSGDELIAGAIAKARRDQNANSLHILSRKRRTNQGRVGIPLQFQKHASLVIVHRPLRI